MPMLPQNRIESLQEKRAVIASLVEKEEHATAIDTIRLRQLKKQKLQLKEIIGGIREDNVAR